MSIIQPRNFHKADILFKLSDVVILKAEGTVKNYDQKNSIVEVELMLNNTKQRLSLKRELFQEASKRDRWNVNVHLSVVD